MSFRSEVSDALRLLFWQKPRATTTTLSVGAIVAIFAALQLNSILIEWVVAGDHPRFNLYGLNAAIAIGAIALLVIVLFARIDRSSAVLRHLVLLVAAVGMMSQLISMAVAVIILTHPESVMALVAWLCAAFSPLLLMLWTTGGARQAFRLVEGVRRPTSRAFAFAVCLWVGIVAAPYWPVFTGEHFDGRSANYWEIGRSLLANYTNDAQAREAQREQQYAQARVVEQKLAHIEAAQPARLAAAIDALAPRMPKKSNLFVVGVSGWGDQDVFAKETRKSLEIVKNRFNVGARMISLVNDFKETDAHPIATIQNLSQTLHAVAARMDKENDVLFLTMTSHGSEGGFALELDGVTYRTLDPKTLKAMLDDAGIKNRILIVSACHAGVFVPVLSDPRSVVIAAAGAKRTSFGCSNDREWTYFGDAFFAHGLKEEVAIAPAFEKARTLIAAWEAEQKLTPSEPEIFIGDEILRKFPALVGTPMSSRDSVRAPSLAGKVSLRPSPAQNFSLAPAARQS